MFPWFLVAVVVVVVVVVTVVVVVVVCCFQLVLLMCGRNKKHYPRFERNGMVGVVSLLVYVVNMNIRF